MTFGVAYFFSHLVCCIWCVAFGLSFGVSFVVALVWHFVCGNLFGMWCNGI